MESAAIVLWCVMFFAFVILGAATGGLGGAVYVGACYLLGGFIGYVLASIIA